MQIERILKVFRQEMRKLYGDRLKQVVLYGSWARGEATVDSDIDLLIILGDEVVPGREIDRMIDIITDLNLEHGILLSVYPISEKDYATVNSPLLLNVRKEGTPT